MNNYDLNYLHIKLKKWNKLIDSIDKQEKYQLEIKGIIDEIYNNFLKIQSNNFVVSNKELYILFFYNTLLEITFLKLLEKNNLIFFEFVFDNEKIKDMQFKKIKEDLNYNIIHWKNKNNLVTLIRFDEKVIKKFEDEFVNTGIIGKKVINDIYKIKNMRDNNSLAHVFNSKMSEQYFVNDKFDYLNLLIEIKNIEIKMDKNKNIIEKELMNIISCKNTADFFKNDILDLGISKDVINEFITNIFNQKKLSDFSQFIIHNLFIFKNNEYDSNEICFKLLINNNWNIDKFWTLYECYFEQIKDKIIKSELWTDLSNNRRSFEYRYHSEDEIFELEKSFYFMFLVFHYWKHLKNSNDDSSAKNKLYNMFYEWIISIIKIESKAFYNFSRWNFIISLTNSFFKECINATRESNDWSIFDDFMSKNEYQSNEYNYSLKKLIKKQ